ncbi:MAG: LytTR family DNA-binding domain-containing protein [Bacteroidota bacterium]
MQDKIRALIVEDEPSAVNRLKKELAALSGIEAEIVAVTESITSTCEWLNKNEVDLAFMDIHLTDGLSFEIFKQCHVKCPVIFTTAYDEYAIQAFKLNSVDYLLKPIEPEELSSAINRYLNRHSSSRQDDYQAQLSKLVQELQPAKYKSSFLVSYRHKMMMIDITEVAYLYIKEKAVFLKTKSGVEYLIDFYLDDLELQLDPRQFYRANRQFLVSRSSIKEIEPYFNGKLLLTVDPSSHTTVTISKEKASHFKRWADS